MSKPLKVFITYAHKNTAAKDELITRLAVLKRNGLISHWHDNEILPGDKWRDAIFSNLADSDLLLYLTSACSLAAENCNKELAAALKEEIRVIPIILEDCDWQEHPLEEFEVLPHKGSPINEWTPESKGWQNVVDGIRRTISHIQAPAPEQGQNVRLAERIFDRGNFLIMLQQFNVAIEAYSDAIALDPRSAAAHNNRGLAYVGRGEIDNAIKDFTEAIELNLDLDPAPYSNRGGAYCEKGELDKAIADFTTAIERDPNRADTFSNRGGAYCRKGELDKAIADFTTAIELDPNFTIAYYGLGFAYLDKGEIEKAIGNFDKAIELNPDYAEAYSHRGIAYFKKGYLDTAIANYNKAIEFTPNYAVAYNHRGYGYRLKGEVDTAINDFDKAIALNPNYVSAYSNRGNAYFIREEFEKAIADFDKVLELDQSDALARQDRERAFQRLQGQTQR